MLSEKLMVYRDIVLTSLLYACETWTLYKKTVEAAGEMPHEKLQSMMNIHRQDQVTNLEVLDRAETTSIKAMILKAQLRSVRHGM